MAPDHYKTLGIAPSASAADLRAAYLKLARSNHPDKFEGNRREAAQAKMQAINEAWNVLGVAHKRREYDAIRPTDIPNSPGPKTMRGNAHFRAFHDDESFAEPDIDFDTTPIAGSKGLPRWMAMAPVGLVVAGLVTVGFGTMVNASGIFALGLMALALGGVAFLMLPLFVMSRAEKDPEL